MVMALVALLTTVEVTEPIAGLATTGQSVLGLLFDTLLHLTHLKLIERVGSHNFCVASSLLELKDSRL